MTYTATIELDDDQVKAFFLAISEAGLAPDKLSFTRRIEATTKPIRTINRRNTHPAPRGSAVRVAMLDILVDGMEHSYTELEDAVEKVGFARTSVSPSMTFLVREGLVERLPNHKVRGISGKPLDAPAQFSLV